MTNGFFEGAKAFEQILFVLLGECSHLLFGQLLLAVDKCTVLFL